ncbi:hypothetical protein [Ruania zhangjianzhongii]|uniref:hypothetical protein n=1 Tax=Ruania zhangjianzhongii TaxID=2603206 RepID=UPI0011C75583|nr:hypothetical protein [Ruania zhangjianzhongii]
MRVTMVTPAHRWLAIVGLLVVIATVVVRFISGVPWLVDSGFSWGTALGWLSLAGYAFLAALWVSWIVRLLRGTTAQVEVPEPGVVRIQHPSRTVQVLAAQDVSVGSFWKWYWVKVRGRSLLINGKEVPRVARTSLVVAGPPANAEEVAHWLRTSLTDAAGPV